MRRRVDDSWFWRRHRLRLWTLAAVGIVVGLFAVGFWLSRRGLRDVGWPVVETVFPLMLAAPAVLLVAVFGRRRHIKWLLDNLPRVVCVSFGLCLIAVGGLILFESYREGGPWWSRAAGAAFAVLGLWWSLVGLFGSDDAVEKWTYGL